MASTSRPSAGSPTAPASDANRVRALAGWLAWHAVELAGVGVPGVLAVTASPWWAIPAGMAGVCWAGHEVHLARTHATPPAPRALTASSTTTTTPDSAPTSADGPAGPGEPPETRKEAHR